MNDEKFFLEIRNLLLDNNILLKKQIELLDQLVKLFSKYDDQYLEEMEKEGIKNPNIT
jgi:hypothetical protein